MPDYTSGMMDDISEKTGYFRISFSLRTTLTPGPGYVAAVWLLLFYRTRDLLSAARLTPSEVFCFRFTHAAKRFLGQFVAARIGASEPVRCHDLYKMLIASDK